MASVKRRIAVFTGKRGGFGAMQGIMRLIQADPTLELQVIASDMHLTSRFGGTLDEVKAFVKVDAAIDLGDYGDTQLERTRALGQLIEKLAPVLQQLDPQILVLLGDRGETLAAAMCAVEMGICVAQIQAGDTSGTLDDIHRHAITKLAHLLFAQNERQRQRVIRLGEDPTRVWNVGAPNVDNILSTPYPLAADARASLGLPRDLDYVIVLQHPDTFDQACAYDHARAIFGGLIEAAQHTLVIYPCSDPGYAGVIRAIDEIAGNPLFHLFKNVEARTFLGLLSGARALIGNSSSGIVEAPYLERPFILVGERQHGRERAANVVQAEPSPAGIARALADVQTPDFREAMRRDNRPFGDGHACQRIYEVLREHPLGIDVFRKRLTY
jgi:GDP/UDP-N,N'-diacetylbacillosamine 2-epimerase (hydrolysing)